MPNKSKRFAIAGAVAILAIAGGTASAATADSGLASSCEEDKCVFGFICDDEPGSWTGCNVVGAFCENYDCDGEPPILPDTGS